jgi:hypothetical protein
VATQAAFLFVFKPFGRHAIGFSRNATMLRNADMGCLLESSTHRARHARHENRQLQRSG